MADRMKLVQGDTRPPVVVQLSDTDGPIDLSDAGCSLVMQFRAEGTTDIIDTITGQKLVGYEEDGFLNTSPPYNVAGAGGRAMFTWLGSTALDNPAGNYEAEVVITFPDGGVQTVYDLLKFKLREDF